MLGKEGQDSGHLGSLSLFYRMGSVFCKVELECPAMPCARGAEQSSLVVPLFPGTYRDLLSVRLPQTDVVGSDPRVQKALDCSGGRCVCLGAFAGRREAGRGSVEGAS